MIIRGASIVTVMDVTDFDFDFDFELWLWCGCGNLKLPRVKRMLPPKQMVYEHGEVDGRGFEFEQLSTILGIYKLMISVITNYLCDIISCCLHGGCMLILYFCRPRPQTPVDNH